jgi:hypothetical protein
LVVSSPDAGLVFREACEGVALRLIFVGLLAVWALAQNTDAPPRFEDFAVKQAFTGTPAAPLLTTPEARRYRTVIRQGVSKGWGVADGATGKELAMPGPNFAGHHVIVTWGCGSPCLMMAIVDLKTGRVFPPPFHHGPGHSYFQLPWAFPAEPPLSYRLDSGLLIANICEADKTVHVDGRLGYGAEKCGVHYFVMNDEGPKLIRRVLGDSGP